MAVMVPVLCVKLHADEEERGAIGCSETSVAQDKWLGRKATRLPSHKSAKDKCQTVHAVCAVFKVTEIHSLELVLILTNSQDTLNGKKI